MIRTQVQLEEEQAERLRRLAAERNRSQAALIRDALDALLSADDRVSRWDRALAAGRSPYPGEDTDDASDVSVNHDAYLAEIYGHDLR